MAEENKPLWRRIHDATCLGHVANLKLLQAVCPVCRADAKKAQESSAAS
ncbi:MAG: hypothetical protein HYS09_01555 [Chloroflexi bacterium]|nr:hypothetical protein [Chloroflexota bacterium]